MNSTTALIAPSRGTAELTTRRLATPEAYSLECPVENEPRYPKPPFCIDQYHAFEIIGRGGMGVVYRVRHATLPGYFAMKLLPLSNLAKNRQHRFRLEVKILRDLRDLRHPNIARFIDANTDGSHMWPYPYFVMELIDGMTLLGFASHRGFDVRQRIELFCDVCDAVQAAHRLNIIHRDLKPDNVLIDVHGIPKVLDFGIASIVGLECDLLGERHIRFLGTPAYASPEQHAGRIPKLTSRSDVFSLGVILYQLLCDALPRRRDLQPRHFLKQTLLDPRRQANHKSNAAFRFYLRRILWRALEHKPEGRFATAGAFADALRELLAAFPPSSPWKRLKSYVLGRKTAHLGRDSDYVAPLRAAVLRKRIMH